MFEGTAAKHRMQCQVHWLEAEGDLGPWRSRIAAKIEATREGFLARAVPPPPFDILIQRVAGAVVPETGMVGHAYREGLVALTLELDNPHLAVALRDGAVRRQMAHEVHYCMHVAGRGYDRTQGEVLVSEVLAGRFTGWLFESLPEPWEQVVEEDALRAHTPNAAILQAPDDDYAVWFFGVGGRLSRWFGYLIGYRLADEWLTTEGGMDGDACVNVPADVVRATARRSLEAWLS